MENQHLFKEILLTTIDEIIESGDDQQPVLLKWSYEEHPDWQIYLGFKKNELPVQEPVTE